MFEILKKKLSKAIESISKKFEKKEEEVKKIEEVKEEIEKKIEPLTEKPMEEALEEVKPIIKEKIPEVKEKIEKAVEEVKEEIKPEIKAIEEKPKEKKNFFKKVTEKIVKKITEKKLTEEELMPMLNELENDLIEADVAFEVAEKIKEDLKKSLIDKEVKKGKEKDAVINALRQSLSEILFVPKIDLEEVIGKAKSENRPAVLIFFGVNGVGKSLSLSKVAYFLKKKGYRPILGAGDTFRAAGSLQLEEYGKKIDVPTITQKQYSDSCAVIFDTISAAKARGYDVVLCDTSGRMHVKKNLIDELAKIVRVNKPDLKILILDSLTGSDVISQLKFFEDAIGVDAIIFSKNDINEKGGNILSACYLFKKPILFLGVGQGLEDLVPYDPEKFLDSLVKG